MESLFGDIDEITKRKEKLAVGCIVRGLASVDDARFVVEDPSNQEQGGITRVMEEAVGIIEGSLLMEVSRDKLGVEGKPLLRLWTRAYGERSQ